MNKVILVGRLTRNVEIKYSGDDVSTAIARYTLAVDRRYKRDGDEQTADFISCVAFGKNAEFLERFGQKGRKFVVEGRLQTGSYTNHDGQKIYTTTVFTEHMEFAESKRNESEGSNEIGSNTADEGGFMNAPDSEEMPFN